MTSTCNEPELFGIDFLIKCKQILHAMLTCCSNACHGQSHSSQNSPKEITRHNQCNSIHADEELLKTIWKFQKSTPILNQWVISNLAGYQAAICPFYLQQSLLAG